MLIKKTKYKYMIYSLHNMGNTLSPNRYCDQNKNSMKILTKNTINNILKYFCAKKR